MTSWIASANVAGNGFPLQSLPFCAFTMPGSHSISLGVGIGDSILDLDELAASGHLKVNDRLRAACQTSTLNALMYCGPAFLSQLRDALTELLTASADSETQHALKDMLVPRSGVNFQLPVASASYTDFYASIEHATNVGKLFRPDQPLLPNYKYVPIGYHGRASSLVVSGTAVRRPNGQAKAPSDAAPSFGPCRQFDYELEAAAIVGTGNALGEPIGMAHADAALFGVSLLNDWSARDIQSWEYQPLGPFLGKNFATSLSPWVVPTAALAPFRVLRAPRPEGDPAPLAYLDDAEHAGAIDIQLEALLSSTAMREAKMSPVRICASNLRDLYWTFPQMLAHHTSGGCNLQPGDVLASGTVSGTGDDAHGCLLELTERGAKPLTLPTGEQRAFLHDGDEVILRGYCEKAGHARISLGECRGVVLPALEYPAATE